MRPGAVAIVAALALLLLPPWLCARSVLRQPDAAWRTTGLSKVGWLLLVVAVPLLGPALYLRRARPLLRGARR